MQSLARALSISCLAIGAASAHWPESKQSPATRTVSATLDAHRMLSAHALMEHQEPRIVIEGNLSIGLPNSLNILGETVAFTLRGSQGAPDKTGAFVLSNGNGTPRMEIIENGVSRSYEYRPGLLDRAFVNPALFDTLTFTKDDAFVAENPAGTNAGVESPFMMRCIRQIIEHPQDGTAVVLEWEPERYWYTAGDSDLPAKALCAYGDWKGRIGSLFGGAPASKPMPSRQAYERSQVHTITLHPGSVSLIA